jgi:hypothetical protein
MLPKLTLPLCSADADKKLSTEQTKNPAAQRAAQVA